MDRIQAFVRDDRMITHFGMDVEEARDGFARVAAIVHDEFLNSHGVAHGALIFAVIDVAFAIAVNAAVDAVGIQWSFNILRSARPGDRVTAECRLIHDGSRLKVVEYEVRDQKSLLLAQGQATALPVHGTTTTTRAQPSATARQAVGPSDWGIATST